jgi:hypothetical protein
MGMGIGTGWSRDGFERRGRKMWMGGGWDHYGEGNVGPWGMGSGIYFPLSRVLGERERERERERGRRERREREEREGRERRERGVGKRKNVISVSCLVLPCLTLSYLVLSRLPCLALTCLALLTVLMIDRLIDRLI